jgi:hypothetical protein
VPRGADEGRHAAPEFASSPPPLIGLRCQADRHPRQIFDANPAIRAALVVLATQTRTTLRGILWLTCHPHRPVPLAPQPPQFRQTEHPRPLFNLHTDCSQTLTRHGKSPKKKKGGGACGTRTGSPMCRERDRHAPHRILGIPVAFNASRTGESHSGGYGEPRDRLHAYGAPPACSLGPLNRRLQNSAPNNPNHTHHTCSSRGGDKSEFPKYSFA